MRGLMSFPEVAAITFALVAIAVLVRTRRVVIARDAMCAGCGYVLVGLSGGAICPECACAVRKPAKVITEFQIAWHRVAPLLWLLLLAGLIGVMSALWVDDLRRLNYSRLSYPPDVLDRACAYRNRIRSPLAAPFGVLIFAAFALKATKQWRPGPWWYLGSLIVVIVGAPVYWYLDVL